MVKFHFRRFKRAESEFARMRRLGFTAFFGYPPPDPPGIQTLDPVKLPQVEPIPADWPVQPLGPDETPAGRTTCGHCELAWDDDKATSMTPAPAARCPFEYFHVYDVDCNAVE